MYHCYGNEIKHKCHVLKKDCFEKKILKTKQLLNKIPKRKIVSFFQFTWKIPITFENYIIKKLNKILKNLWNEDITDTVRTEVAILDNDCLSSFNKL